MWHTSQNNSPMKTWPEAIRIDIAGELEAIIGYEAHAMATIDERAKKILYHIADEERRHVGELQQLLYILSPKEAQYIEEGKKEIQEFPGREFSAIAVVG